MYREIEKKKEILISRQPFSTELRQWVHENNRLELVYCDLRLEGSQLKKEEIEEIFKGELVKSASIWDYDFLEKHEHLWTEVRNSLELESRINWDLTVKLHGMLSREEELGLRTENSMVEELHYVPIHPSKIQREIQVLFQGMQRQKGTVLAKAALLHNQLISIYPFKANNLLAARIAMNYFLMENGYPPVGLGYSREEYFDAVGRYLRQRDLLPFYNGLERAMYNKMEVLMQVSAEESPAER